ncbi:MAG: YkgJ family cysteine cluster protein [Desulfobacterales bacterium]|nr:YkgJ family cysteine cluster protein [Desulfobacterales bacterium]
MKIDFTAYYQRYEKLAKMTEEAFNKVKAQYTESVNCKVGCSDCCYALFDLTLIEAMYINKKFNEKIDGPEKLAIIERAGETDRQIYKLKKQAFKDSQNGVEDVEILGKMSMEKVRCPLLDDTDKCMIYENRPLTCRVYGIPTSTQGMSHICGKTDFVQGEQYPTLDMDKLYGYLYQISQDMIIEMRSPNVKMADILIPVSMALNTTYNPEYFGFKDE